MHSGRFSKGKLNSLFNVCAYLISMLLGHTPKYHRAHIGLLLSEKEVFSSVFLEGAFTRKW